MGTKLNPTIQDFRNILFRLGFTRKQENTLVAKFTNGHKPSLTKRVYAVLCSGQFTPTHTEALRQLGM